MIKKHLKITWRNLVKNRVSSFINIGGLAVGMAVVILIGLWINDELSFNKSFENFDSIAQVAIRHKDLDGIDINRSMPIPLGVDLRSAFGSDFKHVVMATRTDNFIISSGDKTVTQQGRYMQSEGPEMFTLQMLKGSRSALKQLTGTTTSWLFIRSLHQTRPLTGYQPK